MNKKAFLLIVAMSASLLLTACSSNSNHSSVDTTAAPAISEQQEHEQALNDFVRCKSNLKNIATACEMYATDNGDHYPLNIADLTYGYKQQPYLKEIPTCPTCNSSYSYEVHSNPNVYTLQCNGDHRKLGIEENYPKFTCTMGIIENKNSEPSEF